MPKFKVVRKILLSMETMLSIKTKFPHKFNLVLFSINSLHLLKIKLTGCMFAVTVNKIEKFLFFHLLKNWKKHKKSYRERELKILCENTKLETQEMYLKMHCIS